MRNLRQILVALVTLAIFVFIASILFVSALYAFAIFAPIIGLAYAMSRLSLAMELWRSGGRFQIGDGVRIIGAGRARWLGIFTCIEGLAGLALSIVPALVAFSGHFLPVLVCSAAAFVVARSARFRILRDANPIDVLPPE